MSSATGGDGGNLRRVYDLFRAGKSKAEIGRELGKDKKQVGALLSKAIKEFGNAG